MDKLTPKRRSANMRAIRSKNMKPEITVRSLVHRLGYRFRLHAKQLPGTPDLVFAGRRKVIFVHGCFWHQHPKSTCRDAKAPDSNAGYWGAKLARNVERDAQNMARLKKEGWKVLVVWECETRNLESLARRICTFLR